MRVSQLELNIDLVTSQTQDMPRR